MTDRDSSRQRDVVAESKRQEHLTGRSRRFFARLCTIGAALTLLATSVLSSSAGDISYVYDNLGRVIAVIDPATDTAVYAYDAVGNLTGITRQASSTLAIFQFTPSSGPVGTNVTIYGTGFSTTPASNTVKFNGTTATVLTATTTVLMTTVPSGATTGAISVTVGGTTVTSSASFTVGTGTAPTISGFSPTVGTAGTAVTINGTNYDTTPTKNKVTFSPAYGVVNTASATSLGVTVSVGAQSGKIGVATVNGSVLSADEFFVTPLGVNPADVQFTGRIVVGGSTLTATISTANKVALVVFDGVAGQRVSLGMTGVTIASSTVSMFKPDGIVLSTASYGAGGSLDSPVLPVTGTYAIVIDPTSTYTGSMTLTLSAELTGNITIAGSAVTASITRVGQNARYFFTGTAGQPVSLGMTGVTMTQANVSMYKPDGSVLVPATLISTAGGALDSQVLPVSGTYAILVDPTTTYTGNMTLTLYGTADVTGTITIDGATVTPTLTVPGQRARYTFTGTAGQWVNIGFSSVSITSSTVTLLKPDSTSLGSTSISTGGGSLDPTAALPTSGTYTILVDPAGLYTGSMTLTLSSALTGSVTLDGGGVAVSLTRIGQTARYTFSGTAGQWVSLGLSSVSLPSANVNILKPDGTYLTGVSVGTAGGGIEPSGTLPTTGTYTIVVDPGSTYTGSITLTLMSYLTGSLTLDGTPTTATISTIGQNALYTFSGTAGQWVSLGVSSVTLTSGAVTILKPDGTALSTANVSTSGASLDPPVLPTTGTYTVTVNPYNHYTGNFTLTLSSEVTGALVINDPATAITISRAGQNARYTFAGTASQQVTVRVTGNTLGSVTLNLYRPDGTWITGAGNSAASFNLSTVILPTTGTYTVTINPGVTTGALDLQVTNP
jgi:YD repeat-containing protein